MSTVLLSIHIGVGGCGLFSSSNIVLILDNYSEFMYSPPNSTSDTHPMTALIIFASMYICLLPCVISFLPR